MARKRKKEPRVASVDDHGILVRDLQSTLLWIVVSVVIVGVIAWSKSLIL